VGERRKKGGKKERKKQKRNIVMEWNGMEVGVG
jgi:hypothetical protein